MARKPDEIRRGRAGRAAVLALGRIGRDAGAAQARTGWTVRRDVGHRAGVKGMMEDHKIVWILMVRKIEMPGHIGSELLSGHISSRQRLNGASGVIGPISVPRL